jgi:integrase
LLFLPKQRYETCYKIWGGFVATKVKYLLNRDGRYWARVGVPVALRPVIGKRELLKRLGPDRRDALRLLPGAVADLLSILDAAKVGRRSASAPRSRPLFLPQLAAAHYGQELDLDMRERDRGPLYPGHDPAGDATLWRDGYRRVLTKVAAGHAEDDEAGAVIGWAIDAFAERGNTSVQRGTIQWRQLARTLASIQLEALSRQDERDKGNFAGQPSHPELVAKAAPYPNDPLASRRLSPESELPISEIKNRYLKERGAALTMGHEFETATRMFVEHLGDDRPIYRIQRSDIREFARALQELPLHSAAKFPGMTVPKAIRANNARAVPLPTLSVRTISNKYLARLNSLLGWCARNDLLPDNPASGVKLESVKARMAPRVSFAPDDLVRLFGEELEDQPDEFRWAMLISLFAGTRASETAQIKLDSIRHERGVLVVRVEEETKNRNSQRLVPIHRALIDLGIEGRVHKLRKAGETHLFPQWYRQGVESKKRDVNKTLNLHWPKFIPKRFNVTYLKRVGIHDARKTWHSFRHTFRTGLELAGVEKAIADRLTGHADGSMAATYTHGVSIEKLKEAIDRLQFEGFEL